MTEQSFEEHNPQLYLALALLCKESVLVTVKNTEFNNGDRSRGRALTATYESNNEGRQRVRMQYLLQPKRLEPIAQATEAVERWECDVRVRTEVPQDAGRRCHDWCHTCVGTISSAEPLPFELTL